MVNKKRVINKEINYTERSRLIENRIFCLRQLCRNENRRITNKNIILNRKWKKRKRDKDLIEIICCKRRKNMKKKIYLLISSWSIGDDEYGYEVLGAYSNLNTAKNKLEEDLKETIKLHNLNYNTALKEKSDDFYKLVVNHNGIETLSTKIIVKEVEE